MSPEAVKPKKSTKAEGSKPLSKKSSLWVIETPTPLEYMQAREDLKNFLQIDPDEIQGLDELAKCIDIGPNLERTLVYLNREIMHGALSTKMDEITGRYTVRMEPPYGFLSVEFLSLNIVLTRTSGVIFDQASLPRRNAERYVLSDTKYVCAKRLMTDSLLFSSHFQQHVDLNDDNFNELEYETFNPVQFPNQDNISGYLHSLRNPLILIMDFVEAWDKT